jgi:hypothetical protein
MRKTSLTAVAVASVVGLALFATHAPAAAQKSSGGASVAVGGAHASGAGGARSGARSFGGSPGAGSYSGSGARVHGYVNRSRGGDRHVRHFRGGRVYGYAPFGTYDGGYAYSGGCSYYYRRAVATGSSYWWDRYYDCVGE